jgi:hypothetical protein
MHWDLEKEKIKKIRSMKSEIENTKLKRQISMSAKVILEK